VSDLADQVARAAAVEAQARAAAATIKAEPGATRFHTSEGPDYQVIVEGAAEGPRLRVLWSWMIFGRLVLSSRSCPLEIAGQREIHAIVRTSHAELMAYVDEGRVAFDAAFDLARKRG
jgi:hypothetical protein